MPLGSDRDDVLDVVETLLRAQLKAVGELRRKKANREVPASEDAAPSQISKRMSQTDMAYEVLLKTGHPLHILEIVKQVHTLFDAPVTRDSLVSAILKKVAQGQQFVKTGKNTFGLLARDSS